MTNQSVEVGTSRFSSKTATDNRLQSFEKCSLLEPAKQRYYLPPKRSFFLTIMLVMDIDCVIVLIMFFTIYHNEAITATKISKCIFCCEYEWQKMRGRRVENE